VTDCKLCQGYGWIIVGRPNGNSGAKPCDCRRTQETESALGQTPLTPETAAMAVKGLCEVLDYAPPTEIGQGVITSAVLSMCSTAEKAMWLVQRACTLHTKWTACGIAGLRQILCSKYRPKDGINVSFTEAYPEGVPSERPLQVAPAPPALPPGHLASVSPSLEAAVGELAEAKRMPSPQEPIRFVRLPAPIIPESRPERKRITQVDIDRAVEQLRAERAQRELVMTPRTLPDNEP